MHDCAVRPPRSRRAPLSFASRQTLCLAAFATFAAGCGGVDDPLDRQPVSGKVTLDGQPLDQGSISFTPAAGAESGGVPNPGATTAISAGAYELTSDNGPPPGHYTVRINSVEGGAADPNAAPGETKPTKERIPKSWNSESKHEVDIVEGENSFDFEVKSTE